MVCTVSICEVSGLDHQDVGINRLKVTNNLKTRHENNRYSNTSNVCLFSPGVPLTYFTDGGPEEFFWV